MTVITVSQLNRYVKSLLESDANLQSFWLHGEISNFTNHVSGHLYFSLKDEAAIAKAVMFRTAAERLVFLPENGMKVLVRARVSLYEKSGSYQLYVEEMQPDGTGALQLAYEQLKRRLEEEGLFDANRKKPLPRYVRRVGVITSPTGAARRDIENVLGRRYPLAQIIFHPAAVQGEEAPAQLRRALYRFEEMKEKNDPNTPDVIIIGRGGGSLEELWAFNDEGLARTVGMCTIPVISAVGHETDFTICDFVADLRAPTPSAAAELAVPDRMALLSTIDEWHRRAASSLSAKAERERRYLETLCSHRCLSSPFFYVEERQEMLDHLSHTFYLCAKTALSGAERRLGTALGKLDTLSPLRVMARGYAIAETNGKVLGSVKDVTVGDPIALRLFDGTLSCRVTERMKEGNDNGKRNDV